MRPAAAAVALALGGCALLPRQPGVLIGNQPRTGQHLHRSRAQRRLIDHRFHNGLAVHRHQLGPNSLAAAPAVRPSLTRVTAKSLNSVVYGCFGNFIVLPFMVTASIRHPWKTKFRGKLIRLLRS